MLHTAMLLVMSGLWIGAAALLVVFVKELATAAIHKRYILPTTDLVFMVALAICSSVAIGTLSWTLVNAWVR